MAAAIALLAGDARALEPEVTSDTAAQFYDVRSPTGQTVLSERRLTTTLGVSVYDLLDRDKTATLGPELNFRARMRYDADYGASSGETNNTNYQSFIPGFSRGPVDLMYAYLEGRRFLHGWVNFKLGRQYVTDVLGWWSFDGGEVKVTSPYYLAVEAYGGLEQRGGMPLSTPRFESDGVWRGDRSGYDSALYPAFQPANIAPAFGAALETTGFTWAHARLTYRRVYNTGTVGGSDFASGLYTPTTYDGSRISSEKIGYALDVEVGKFAALKGGFAYDLYDAKMGTVYGSLDTFVSRKLTVSLDYDYYAPTFDGDSIWNFFLGEPMSDLGLRASFDATDQLSIAASAQARVTTVETSPASTNSSPNVANVPGQNANYFPSNGAQFDEGGNLAVKYKMSEGSLGLRSAGNFGYEGDRVGADLYGERTLERRYVFEARVNTWQWNDKLRPDRDATNVGYVAGVGYRFAPKTEALVEWQHDMNRLVGQRFRLMLWLTLAVTK